MVSTLWLAAARIWNHFHIWPRGACVFVRTYGLELRILEKIHLLQQLWEPWGFHWRKKQFFCSSMRFQCFDCSNARRISDMFFSCYYFFFFFKTSHFIGYHCQRKCRRNIPKTAVTHPAALEIGDTGRLSFRTWSSQTTCCTIQFFFPNEWKF